VSGHHGFSTRNAETAEAAEKGVNDLTEKIIAAAIEVHRHLGPGMLESTYETCLAHELTLQGLQVQRQLSLPIEYKGMRIDSAYRLDLLVAAQVVVEVKAVQAFERVHPAQLLTYLRLANLHVGLLINFNVKILKNGIRRVVNALPK